MLRLERTITPKAAFANEPRELACPQPCKCVTFIAFLPLIMMVSNDSL
jgi:hypothetical protein